MCILQQVLLLYYYNKASRELARKILHFTFYMEIFVCIFFSFLLNVGRFDYIISDQKKAMFSNFAIRREE